jgi:hypothetical protein
MSEDFFVKKKKVWHLDGWDRVVASGVAVAGWQWCQSIDHINAVRMVPVREW